MPQARTKQNTNTKGTNMSLLDKLNKNLEKEASSKFTPDERLFKLDTKSGTGQAKVQFLVDKNISPFVERNNFAINSVDASQKSGKRWMIDDSRLTLGEECPVYNLNKALYAVQGLDDKVRAALAKPFFKRTSYTANVKIINYPSNPSLEGKVMLFTFSKTLKDKLMNAAHVSDEDKALGKKPMFVFDPLKGHNVILNLSKQASGFMGYDNTSFVEETPIFETEEQAIAYINENTHDLTEFTDESHFTSYDEQVKRLTWVLENYTQEAIPKAQFDAIVAKTLGTTSVSVPDETMTPVFVPDETPVSVETPVETPASVETLASVETPVQAPAVEDDLSFLD